MTDVDVIYGPQSCRRELVYAERAALASGPQIQKQETWLPFLIAVAYLLSLVKQ
jgi:hypothetical protein